MKINTSKLQKYLLASKSTQEIEFVAYIPDHQLHIPEWVSTNPSLVQRGSHTSHTVLQLMYFHSELLLKYTQCLRFNKSTAVFYGLYSFIKVIPLKKKEYLKLSKTWSSLWLCYEHYKNAIKNGGHRARFCATWMAIIVNRWPTRLILEALVIRKGNYHF